jgi:hypothetical protein
MRPHLQGLFATLAVTFALGQPALGAYHVEVTSTPGVNMFQIELWGDGNDAELGTEIINLAAQVEFSNFTGNIDASSLSVSLDQMETVFPIPGYTATPISGNDFSVPITFGVFKLPGDALPPDANSPENAWAVFQVKYTSTGTGMFDAAVLPPLGSAGTVVNDNMIPVIGSASPTTLSAIPEPSSFILVGLMAGLGYGCVWLRRRRATTE